MTVAELIDVLNAYPQDMLVLVDGYEEGYDDIHEARIACHDIALYASIHSWNGEHLHAEDGPKGGVSIVKALVLSRNDRR